MKNKTPEQELLAALFSADLSIRKIEEAFLVRLDALVRSHQGNPDLTLSLIAFLDKIAPQGDECADEPPHRAIFDLDRKGPSSI